jgi:anti-sigma-K factor RskA
MSIEQDPFREATGMYVLGALGAEERRAFEAHLPECEACATEVRSLRAVTGALPYAVPYADPPPALRGRVLAAAVQARRPSPIVGCEPQRKPASAAAAAGVAPRSAPWAWGAAAASVLVAVGLAAYAGNLRAQLRDSQIRLVNAVSRLEESEQRLQVASRETTSVRASLALLTAADVVELRLRGQAPAPTASARAFLSRSRGVLFAATSLPAIPNDRTYQLWFLTPGAPVSAGLVRPDAEGSATAAFAPAGGVARPTGLALSLEPEGGVGAPTGAIYLVSQ